jgi:hypothetical protein
MTAAGTGGMELVISIVVEPSVDRQGLLSLHVAAVRVGAVNVTALARPVARRMYAEHLEKVGEDGIDPGDARQRVLEALLLDKPFEGLFNVGELAVRVSRVTVDRGRLVVGLDATDRPAPKDG